VVVVRCKVDVVNGCWGHASTRLPKERKMAREREREQPEARVTEREGVRRKKEREREREREPRVTSPSAKLNE
jgi:hypothetical protein